MNENEWKYLPGVGSLIIDDAFDEPDELPEEVDGQTNDGNENDTNVNQSQMTSINVSHDRQFDVIDVRRAVVSVVLDEGVVVSRRWVRWMLLIIIRNF